MKKILNVGIIGAGTISNEHISAYLNNDNARIAAISDLNEELARSKAAEYGILSCHTDYKDILRDETIDAVSIVTPPFTHCEIVIDALNAKKHVLCEKPPAMNADEAARCAQTAENTGKLLMYAFVCRFRKEIQFLKDYIESGNMGRIYSAEASRISRCSVMSGWFVDKKKAGGGALMDGAIHELDEVLYLMGYPKPKTVQGFSSCINNDLPDNIKGIGVGWQSADKTKYNRTIESMANGFITFESGSCLFLKSSSVLYSVTEKAYIDISAEKAGARFDGKTLDMVSATNNGYLMEFKPVLSENVNMFHEEINHFVDCCQNGTKCICTAQQGVQLMKIIDAVYKSAETGKPVEF